LHGGVQLRPAIATARAEDIAGEAFAVDADENAFSAAYVTANEGDVMLAIHFGAIEMQVEIAVVRGHLDDFNRFNEFFAGAAMFDERGDGSDF
jgi:hypothetical protein